MKKRTMVSGTALCLLSSVFLLVALTASPASADFYVIAGSRGVGTKITSLPYTISSPGFYYITKDLSCSGAHGIIISADNVTVDLMGFSLSGDGTGSYDGIYMSGRANVEIRNGTVRNFGLDGIHETSSVAKGHRVINIRARDNGNRGINVLSKNSLVERCTSMGNGSYGIVAGNGSTITGNTCYTNSDYGIYAYSGVTVTGNTCYYNSSYGIYANTGATVTGNTCRDNEDHGIWASTGSTVTGNTCYSNDSDGIHTDIGATVTGNTCSSNDSDGIYANTGSTVTGNTCYGNGGYGIYLCGHNLVDQNTAYNNTGGNMTACATCEFGINVAAP
jgi:parallel beta-helix repeat protein